MRYLSTIVGSLLALQVAAQNSDKTAEYLQGERQTSEILTQKAERYILDLDEIGRKIGGWAENTGEWISDGIRHTEIELRLNHELDFDIRDSEIKKYLHDNYPEINPRADVIRIDGDSAYVQVRYPIHFDDADIFKQYVFKLERNVPTEIIGHGEEWAERYNHKIGIDELFSLIKLDKEFQERWDVKATETKGFEYSRSSDAFEALSELYPEYNPSNDDIVIANDMTRAQIGIEYIVRDEFENVQNDVKHYVIEQYVNTSDGWKFDETLYSAQWKEGILIGTDKNRFQDDDFFDVTKQKVKDWINDFMKYMRE